LDIELLGEPDVPSLPAKLSAALPEGIDVIAAGVIDDRRDSLQHEVTSCTWDLVAAGATITQLRMLAAEALAADAIVITRTRSGPGCHEKGTPRCPTRRPARPRRSARSRRRRPRPGRRATAAMEHRRPRRPARRTGRPPSRHPTPLARSAAEVAAAAAAASPP